MAPPANTAVARSDTALIHAEKVTEIVEQGLGVVELVLKVGAAVPILGPVCEVARSILEDVRTCKEMVDDVVEAGRHVVDTLKVLKRMADNLHRLGQAEEQELKMLMKDVKEMLGGFKELVSSFGKRGFFKKAMQLRKHGKTLKKLDRTISEKMIFAMRLYQMAQDASAAETQQEMRQLMEEKFYKLEEAVASKVQERAVGSKTEAEVVDELEKDVEALHAVAQEAGISDHVIMEEMREFGKEVQEQYQQLRESLDKVDTNVSRLRDELREQFAALQMEDGRKNFEYARQQDSDPPHRTRNAAAPLILDYSINLPANEVEAVLKSHPEGVHLLNPSAEAATAEGMQIEWVHIAGGNFEAVEVKTLVGMLKRKRLVVLNGNESYELGVVLLEAGVPYVVCWSTRVLDRAAAAFAEGFWNAMKGWAGGDDKLRGDDAALREAVRTAFGAAKDRARCLATDTEDRPSAWNGRIPADVQQYVEGDPDEPSTAPPTGGRRYGIPLLLLHPRLLSHIPKLPAHFCRRKDAEDKLRSILLDSSSSTTAITPAMALTGTAGLGKTTMAIWCANDAQVWSRFADGVLWLVFGEQRNALEMLHDLASRLGLPPEAMKELKSKDERAAIDKIRGLLKDQHVLIVLDDVWRTQQVQPFTELCPPTGSTISLLLTSRNTELGRLFGGGDKKRVLPLAKLEDEDSKQVLMNYSGKSEQQLLDDREVDELIKRCCGLPVVLRAVATLLYDRSAAEILAIMNRARERKKRPGLPPVPEYSHEHDCLFIALEVTLSERMRADPGVVERYEMLAIFPEDTGIPLDVACAIWGIDVLEARECARTLGGMGLNLLTYVNKRLELLDIHRHYLLYRARENLAGWHAHLFAQAGHWAVHSYLDKSNHFRHHLLGARGGWKMIADAHAVPIEFGSMLSNKGLQDEGMSALSDAIASGALANLKELDLRINQIGDEGMRLFSDAIASGALANLGTLDLRWNQIGDAGMRSLSDAIASGALANLEKLNLSWNWIGVEGIQAFLTAIASGALACPSGGRKYTLSWFSSICKRCLAVKGEPASGALANLEQLFLASNRIGDDGMRSLSEAIASGALANLTQLNLWNNQIGDAGMRSLSDAIASGALANLTQLNLWNNQIGDAGMRSLSDAIASGALANLTRLDLDNNQIGDAGIRLLSDAIASGALANLEKLYLDANQIGDAGMCSLSAAVASGALANLKLLDLRGNHIGDEGMRSLSDTIASGALANLTRLDLVDNQIGDAGIRSLSDGIASGALANLEQMDLGGNEIGDEGMRSLSDAIASGALANLKKLYFQRNQIGDTGMRSLSDAIASGALANLLELNLACNKFGNVGMRSFSDAIASGALANLKQLSLGRNQIGDVGMCSLSAAIASGALANLHRLDLNENSIGDAGIRSLSDAIASGALANLQLLWLNSNQIGDEGIKSFSSAIASGALANLKELKLYGNRIGDEGMRSLSDAIASGALAKLKDIYIDSKHMRNSHLVQACKARSINIHWTIK